MMDCCLSRAINDKEHSNTKSSLVIISDGQAAFLCNANGNPAKATSRFASHQCSHLHSKTYAGMMPPASSLMGCTFPFFILLFSRWLAKRSHNIHIIRPNHFESESEKSLYSLVASLSRKAGIRKVPEIGIYVSDELNAFATGRSRNSSLVAFSSGLLESLEERGIAAVAAHEIAHIANGDMVTLALVQSVVNTIILLCTIPLKLIEWIALFSDQVSAVAFWITSIIRFLITLLLVFLGSLVVKAFSRRREFHADKLAAKLLDPNSMIHALESLKHDKPVILRKQKAYAALKISSPKRFMDLFSTHPSIEKRIFALQKLTK